MTQHIDLDALQALAEAATPGPWLLNTTRMGDKLLGWHIAADPHGSSLPICLSDKYSEFRNAEQEIANARLIIAANPAAILSLIDRLRRAEAVSKWISVEDRLPETFITDDSECWLQCRRINAAINSVRVLVALSGQGVRVDRLAGLEGSPPYWETYGKRVTHWMPLPAAPDSEGAKG